MAARRARRTAINVSPDASPAISDASIPKGLSTRQQGEEIADAGRDRQRGHWLLLHVSDELSFDILRARPNVVQGSLTLGAKLLDPESSCTLRGAHAVLAG